MIVHRTTRFLATLVAFMLLAACAGGQGPEEVAGGESGDSLVYWSMWNEGEPQQVVLQGIIEEFEQETGTSVDVLWGGREILTRVRSALSSGNPPDLVDKDAEELAGALIQRGQTVSLQDVVNRPIEGEDVTIAEDVPASYLELFSVDGEPHLVPYEVITSGIWYDGNMFDELGVEPPATWEEFMDLNQEIRDQGVEPIQADTDLDYYNAYWYYWSAMRHAGPGSLLEAAQDKTGEAWNDPALVAAAEDVEELVSSGALAEGYRGNKWPSAQTAWAQGNAAMMLVGSWLPSETSEYAKEDFEYRMFEYPMVEGGHDSVEIYLIGWSIIEGSANPTAAEDFISFAMNRERIVDIVHVAKNLVPRSDFPTTDGLEDVSELLEQDRPVHRVYDGLQADLPAWWTNVFLPLNDELFLGQIGADEFISGLEEQSRRFWESQG